METSIFKFYNIATAKFVVEQLINRGCKAKLLSSGFISIVETLDEESAKLITEQRGVVVVSGPSVTPAISKILGSAAMVDRRKLPPPAEEPKSPPTFGEKSSLKTKQMKEEKTPKKDTKTPDTNHLKTFAFDALKKVVEKYPKRFPKLAKMFGIKVKE